MPRKKRNNRLDDSDEEIPSIITAEDLENTNDELVINKKAGNKKKNKKTNKPNKNEGIFIFIFKSFLY